MAFEWLDHDDRQALVDALIALGLTGERRRVLLADLDPRFRLQLRNMPDDLAQLQSDIAEINRVERLTDDSVPLRRVLRRAEAEAALDPAAQATIRRLRARVEARLEGQPLADVAVPPPAEIPEAVVNRNDMVDFAFLLRGAAAGRSVARLVVTAHEDGIARTHAGGNAMTHRGTGWLIAPGLLLTCHHVINARRPDEPPAAEPDLTRQVETLRAHFDLFDATAAGDERTGARLIACAPPPLDYALLALDTGDRPPLALDPTPIDARQYIAVNILQHPEGAPLRVALRNNVVAGADDTGVRYYTDTLPGASGAPVCDDTWRVRAVHRATRGTAAVYGGKRVQFENVGTPIAAILADLAQRAPGVKLG
ncbi:MAG: trypsin-like peptidase domain-containing protein [Myxococcales bacterium]|nr:trypsin-like peptidase domain-containing protein [Myxococcales bacterium]MCB9542981.1 trypsin-like peptidase domain-containing protein [Myxococcales bacterium]